MKNVNMFKNFLRGMGMGVAEGVPGVSGSTIALLLGIYERFVDLLHSVSLLARSILLFMLRKQELAQIKAAWKAIDFEFAVPLGVGTVVSLLLFAVFIDGALQSNPEQIYAAFFGLTLATLFIPCREIYQGVKSQGYSLARAVILSVISFCGLLVFLDIIPRLGLATDGYSPLFVFGAGVLAISGMLFPGVSGSFILLMLGLYQYIYSGMFKAILSGEADARRLLDLGIFVLGLVAGFLVLIRLIKLALAKHRVTLMALVLGVLVGSLRVLWPIMQVQEGVKVSQYPKLGLFDVSADRLMPLVVIAVISMGFGLVLILSELYYGSVQSVGIKDKVGAKSVS